MQNGLDVKYPCYSCLIWMKLEFSLRFFKKKTPISNFVKIHPVGAKLFHADGRMVWQVETDRYDDAISRVYQFCKCAWKWSSSKSDFCLTLYKLVMKVESHLFQIPFIEVNLWLECNYFLSLYVCLSDGTFLTHFQLYAETMFIFHTFGAFQLWCK
jgi:hypothetical protein